MKIIRNETLCTNSWGSICAPLVVDTAGRESVYPYVERPDGVVVLAHWEDKLLFVRHRRLPFGEETLELPSGALESGESVLEAATRELREESGVALSNPRVIGCFAEAPAYSTVRLSVVAGDIDDGRVVKAGCAEEILGTHFISYKDFIKECRNGVFTDAASLAALKLLDD